MFWTIDIWMFGHTNQQTDRQTDVFIHTKQQTDIHTDAFVHTNQQMDRQTVALVHFASVISNDRHFML